MKDDDVICMSVTIEKLLKRNNIIKIIYVVSGIFFKIKKGINAVRENDKNYKILFEKLKKKFEKKHKNINQNIRNELYKKYIKRKTREYEAIHSTTSLGIKKENLFFFNSKFYNRRGIVFFLLNKYRNTWSESICEI
jgi:hypothetical protein